MKFSLIPASALEILKLDALTVVYPVSLRSSFQENIEVVPLEQYLLG